MINGNTGTKFWLGNYDSVHEVMHLTPNVTAASTIDSGTVLDWSAVGNVSDGRLLLIAKVDGNPGAGRSYGSLVRELLYDRGVSQLISRPVAEYKQLRNRTFFERRPIVLPPSHGPNPVLHTLFAGGTAGGAIDLLLSVDLSANGSIPPGEAVSGFGVAVRAAHHTVHDSLANAAMRLTVNISAADKDGVRTALLISTGE
jgi:hypothetical protein